MDKQKHGRTRHDSSDLTYLRKIKKPLVEKKRRERINTSLLQLKQLLLENIKMNGGTQVSKLDKADILELTVSHLRHIQLQQKTVAMATQCSDQPEYTSGYREAARDSAAYFIKREAISFDGNSTTFMNNPNMNLNKLFAPERTSTSTVITSGHSNVQQSWDRIETNSINTNPCVDNFCVDANGNVTNRRFLMSAVDTNYLSFCSGHVTVADDIAHGTDEVKKEAINLYSECGNALSQTSMNASTLDYNGNFNGEVVNEIKHFNNHAGDVNARVEAEDDSSDSDGEDRLYIHLDDGNNVNVNIRNFGNDGNDVQRDNVWRPW